MLLRIDQVVAVSGIVVVVDRLLLGLEVVEENATLLRLLTPVLDDDARAVDDLAGVAFAVDLAQPSPLAQLLPIRHLDQRNLVLAAQRHDQLLVRLLLTRLIEHAHVGLATIEGFAGFAEATGQAVVDESDLEDSLEGVDDAHGAGLGAAIGGDLDLLGGRDFFGCGGLFSVRHREWPVGCLIGPVVSKFLKEPSGSR